jgi:hypothetical protein
MSTMTLEGMLMYCDLVFDSDLQMEPKDCKIVQKRTLTGNKAKDIDKDIQEEMERKEETQKKQRREKEQRKEGRERKESLLGVALETDIKEVKWFSSKELVKHLLLWQAIKTSTKITLKGSIIEKRDHVLQLLKQANCSPHKFRQLI